MREGGTEPEKIEGGREPEKISGGRIEPERKREGEIEP